MVNVIGFVASRAIAEREGVGADRATQLGLIGSLIGGPGISPIGVVLTQTIARREATATAPPIPPSTLVEVPDVVGRDAADAASVLAAVGLKSQRTREDSTTVPIETVIRQQPGAGARLVPGDLVTLVVSAGTRVPALIGKSADAAKKELSAVNLVAVEVERPSDGVVKGFVIDQDPSAGSLIPPGSRVWIAVSSGPGVVMPDVVGRRADEAEDELGRLGIGVNQIGEPNAAYVEGFVFAQDPQADQPVEAGVVATLRVSTGAPGGGVG